MRLLSVATAVPEHRIEQASARELAQMMFQDAFPDLDRLLPIFENARIDSRHTARPLSWFAKQHTFPESNAAYVQCAQDISEQAAREAMKRAGVAADQIGTIVFVSSTGIATPSLDSKLMQRLGLSPSTARIPVWGLGCAGGVAGLARATDIARSRPGVTLFIATELCSLTFQRNDMSRSNLVATGLFGDGAAAVLLGKADSGPQLVASFSHLFNDSEDIMGWDLSETGLRVRFSRDIPSLIRASIPGLFKQACESWGVSEESIKHFVLHPGGVKVVDAMRESLDISESSTKAAFDILREYGNMSSASVLFVLERYLKSAKPDGENGVMMAMGPGFSSEQLLFRLT